MYFDFSCMASVFNKRKKILLELMRDGRWHTAKDIYELLLPREKTQISIYSIRMALLRYFRQGLLHRKRSGYHREYKYKLSKRGFERLSWLAILSESA